MKLKEKLGYEFSLSRTEHDDDTAFVAGFEKALSMSQEYYNDNLDSEYIDFERLGEEDV